MHISPPTFCRLVLHLNGVKKPQSFCRNCSKPPKCPEKALSYVGVWSYDKLGGEYTCRLEVKQSHFFSHKNQYGCAHTDRASATLYSVLEDEGDGYFPLSVNQSLYYLQQILQAVHYLHSNSILYCDIKCMTETIINYACVCMRLDSRQTCVSRSKTSK